MISIYSVVSSIIFYNLSLIILFILRRRTDFMARYAISTLLFLSVLSMVRLFVPIDIEAAHVIESEVIIPEFIEILEFKHRLWPLSVGRTLLAIWFVGIVVHAMRICFAEYKAYRARKIYPRIETEQLSRVSARFDKPYKIIISPKVSQPYTAGIFNPVVYLPYIEYSDTELYFILLHETQHINSHDNLKRLLFLIVEVVFWWNPLAHVAVDEFELLTEYNCDSRLAASMDSDTLVEYLRTIISVMKRLNPDEDKAKLKLALMFAQTYDIKQRFEVLLRRNDRKPRRIRYAVWVIMLAIFVMSYFVIIQPFYSAPAIYTDVASPVGNNNSYILERDGCYFHMYNELVVDELSEDELSMPPYNNLIIIGEYNP